MIKDRFKKTIQKYKDEMMRLSLRSKYSKKESNTPKISESEIPELSDSETNRSIAENEIDIT